MDWVSLKYMTDGISSLRSILHEEVTSILQKKYFNSM